MKQLTFSGEKLDIKPAFEKISLKREKFTKEELDNLVETVFKYYRKKGFPFIRLTDRDIKRSFGYLKGVTEDMIFLNGIGEIQQNMSALDIINHFHPEIWNVKCRNFKTPMEVFHDDDLFRKAIRKRIKIGTDLKPYGIRKILASYSGTQRVSIFRPSVAKAIYDRYCRKRTLDFSAGWGSRLLGAIASEKEYVGIDPAIDTMAMNRALGKKMETLEYVKCGYKLITDTAEEYLERDIGTFDLVFTSPPYFDVEHYTDSPTQSYKKFPTYREWLSGFLFKAIQLAVDKLEPNGYFILNVAQWMHNDVRNYMDSIELAHQITWKMRLSALSFSKTNTFKYEPVLVFRKGE